MEGRKGTREIVGGDVEKLVSFGSRASASASITVCGVDEEHLRSVNAHNVWQSMLKIRDQASLMFVSAIIQKQRKTADVELFHEARTGVRPNERLVVIHMTNETIERHNNRLS